MYEGKIERAARENDRERWVPIQGSQEDFSGGDDLQSETSKTRRRRAHDESWERYLGQ